MHKYRIPLLRFLKIMALIIPVVLFLLFLPVNNSDDTRRIQDFYLEEPNSLDVVLLGSSDVYAGFSPTLAYSEFGFTSYPYVMSGNYIGMLPYQLEDVLTTQSPSLIVIEITEAMNGKPESYDHRLREYIAGLPTFHQRHRRIQELGNKENLLSYYLPFSLYHGTASPKVLVENGHRAIQVHRRGYSLLKGSLTYTGDGYRDNRTFIHTTGDHSTTEMLPHIRKNFIKLLDYLQAADMKNVLFVTFPHRTPDEGIYFRHQQANSVGDLIRSYGYDYINLDCYLDDMGIQPDTDFLDDEHLNLYGQYKNTRYLCDILTQEYGIGQTPLSEENRREWDACAQYQQRYYEFFDNAAKAGGTAQWLKEDSWLYETLEDTKK